MSSYDHTPRPEIEQHYHIRNLIEGQEKRTEDRNYHRNKDKAKEERGDSIRESKLIDIKEFWCDHCKRDFRCVTYRQVETDWSNTSQHVAFYKGKHRKCGRWAIRLITDKNRDGYWMKSRLVRIDQGKHHNDTIQPWQTNFNLLYGKR